MRLSPGDKVICVNNKDREKYLVLGREYTVKSTRCRGLVLNFVTLDGSVFMDFIVERFIPAKEHYLNKFEEQL